MRLACRHARGVCNAHHVQLRLHLSQETVQEAPQPALLCGARPLLQQQCPVLLLHVFGGSTRAEGENPYGSNGTHGMRGAQAATALACISPRVLLWSCGMLLLGLLVVWHAASATRHVLLHCPGRGAVCACMYLWVDALEVASTTTALVEGGRPSCWIRGLARCMKGRAGQVFHAAQGGEDRTMSMLAAKLMWILAHT